LFYSLFEEIEAHQKEKDPFDKRGKRRSSRKSGREEASASDLFCSLHRTELESVSSCLTLQEISRRKHEEHSFGRKSA
jgi:hypothetical protein